MLKMYRIHEFFYIPKLIGAKKRYILELGLDEKPKVFKTMTTDMKSYFGHILDIYDNKDDNHPYALVQTSVGTIEARVLGQVKPKHPCWVWEHLKIDGHMELVVTSERVLENNINFINYGVPLQRYLRIDIYTGEWRLINA